MCALLALWPPRLAPVRRIWDPWRRCVAYRVPAWCAASWSRRPVVVRFAVCASASLFVPPTVVYSSPSCVALGACRFRALLSHAGGASGVGVGVGSSGVLCGVLCCGVVVCATSYPSQAADLH